MPIRETRLVERAIRQRWPVKAALRTKVVNALADVLADASASPREKVAACRALISAGKCNLDAIRTASLVRRLDVMERSDAFEECARTLRETLDELTEEDAEEAEPEPSPESLNGHGA